MMLEILKAKIERNDLRIDIWKLCKKYTKDHPNRFRLKYERSNFILERKIDKNNWESVIISEPEI